MFYTAGIMLSNDNIAHLSGSCNDLEKLIKSKREIPQKNDCLFEEERLNHTVLYHDGKNNQLINLCESDS